MPLTHWIQALKPCNVKVRWAETRTARTMHPKDTDLGSTSHLASHGLSKTLWARHNTRQRGVRIIPNRGTGRCRTFSVIESRHTSVRFVEGCLFSAYFQFRVRKLPNNRQTSSFVVGRAVAHLCGAWRAARASCRGGWRGDGRCGRAVAG